MITIGRVKVKEQWNKKVVHQSYMSWYIGRQSVNLIANKEQAIVAENWLSINWLAVNVIIVLS